jgi:hypothetical protein
MSYEASFNNENVDKNNQMHKIRVVLPKKEEEFFHKMKKFIDTY